MNFRRLERFFDRTLDKVLGRQGLNSGRVTLVWDAAPPPADAMRAASYSAPSAMSEEVDALVHFVTVNTVMKQGASWQAGDAIVTFSPRTQLSGRRNLRFILRSRMPLAGCTVGSGSAIVICPSTAGLAVGATVFGSGIPIGARVFSVDSATRFTLTQSATANITTQLFQADIEKDYVQASTGRGLEEFWDVTFGGQRKTVTVLLRLRGDSAGVPPSPTGDEVWLVDSAGTRTAYRWNGSALMPDAASADAVIRPVQDGVIFALAGSQVSRFSQMAGLQAASFSDTLDTATLPRMEFHVGGNLAATLTAAGWAGLTVTDAPVSGGLMFTDALGRALFSITGDGVISAPLFTS